MDLVLITTFLLILSIYILRWYMKRTPLYNLADKLEKPEGFTALPFLGHALNLKDPEAYLKMCLSFKSPYSVVYIGSRIFFFLNDPYIFEEVLTSQKCLNKPEYLQFDGFGNEGSFIMRGEKWKYNSKLLRPAFNHRMLNFYFSKFDNFDNNLINNLNMKVGDKAFNIRSLLLENGMNKMLACIFGIEGKDFYEKLAEHIDIFFHYNTERMLSLFYNFDIIHKLKPSYKQYKRSVEALISVTNEIIDKRRCKLQEDSQPNGFEFKKDEKEMIFIDYLLRCSETGKFDKNNIDDEIFTYLYASTDTMPVTASFACICLGMFPDVQEKAYNEICEVLGDRPYESSYYSKMPYMQGVIKESLRLFPVAPNVMRVPNCDLKIGEHTFPKDSLLTINIFNVHRSSKYYSNPKKFDPDRFSLESEEAKNRPKFAFIPFMAGKRSCPGEHFAMMTLITTLISILRKFRLETTYKSIDEIRLKVILLIDAIDGYPIRVYPRN